MHFWIDKRSNYGIGHNRSMAGLTNHQHRRMRSKSIVTPLRQHPACIPSTSQHHAKSHHLSHHRNRQLQELDVRTNASRIPQESNPESSTYQSQSAGLNSNHVPVVHSVYPRDETNHLHHVVGNSRGNAFADTSFPVYLKGGICIAMAIILLTVKLYFDNELNGLQLVTFGSMSLVLLVFTMTITILRMRKKRSMLHLRVENEVSFQPIIDEPVVLNQSTTQSLAEDDSNDLPPPYAVAVRLPEKQSIIDCSPPPSYEKIHMI